MVWFSTAHSGRDISAGELDKFPRAASRSVKQMENIYWNRKADKFKWTVRRGRR